MNHRRAFTLVELVIVILIIGIILAIVAHIGTYFSQRARFDNKKEEISNDITSLIHTAMSTDAVNVSGTFYTYGQLAVSMTTGGAISEVWSSGQLTSPMTTMTIFTGVTLLSSTLSFTAVPYGLGCQTNAINPSFSLSMPDNNNLKACFQLDPHTCKLSEIRCAN